MNKKIIIFASGTKDGGGTGFENLVNASRKGILNAEISAVISNHENGGVRERADRLGIPFVFFTARRLPDSEKFADNLQTSTGTANKFIDKDDNPIDPKEFGTAENYQNLTKDADLICLSGWLKLVTGLDPRKTINIHPGPLPQFGGSGMYGHYVHEAVMEAYKKKTLDILTGKPVSHSAVSMHFVTEKYDEGPVFFRHAVEIMPEDTADILAARVLEQEHKWQPVVTNKVLMGEISWDGKNPKSLKGQIIN